MAFFKKKNQKRTMKPADKTPTAAEVWNERCALARHRRYNNNSLSDSKHPGQRLFASTLCQPEKSLLFQT